MYHTNCEASVLKDFSSESGTATLTFAEIRFQGRPERIYASQRYRQVLPRMILFPLCLVFTSFIRWAGKVLGVMKGLLEPPVKTTFVDQWQFCFSLLSRKNWVASPIRTDASIHPHWKSSSSSSLREKVSLEGSGATSRLPQERG